MNDENKSIKKDVNEQLCTSIKHIPLRYKGTFFLSVETVQNNFIFFFGGLEGGLGTFLLFKHSEYALAQNSNKRAIS